MDRVTGDSADAAGDSVNLFLWMENRSRVLSRNMGSCHHSCHMTRPEMSMKKAEKLSQLQLINQIGSQLLTLWSTWFHVHVEQVDWFDTGTMWPR